MPVSWRLNETPGTAAALEKLDTSAAFNLALYREQTSTQTMRTAKPDVEAFALTQEGCRYCGEPPAPMPEKHTRRKRLSNADWRRNGIDRVDNSKGYVSGNVVACCSTCNRMKHTLGVEEFLQHVSRIHRHQHPTSV